MNNINYKKYTIVSFLFLNNVTSISLGLICLKDIPSFVERCFIVSVENFQVLKDDNIVSCELKFKFSRRRGTVSTYTIPLPPSPTQQGQEQGVKHKTVFPRTEDEMTTTNNYYPNSPFFR